MPRHKAIQVYPGINGREQDGCDQVYPVKRVKGEVPKHQVIAQAKQHQGDIYLKQECEQCRHGTYLLGFSISLIISFRSLALIFFSLAKNVTRSLYEFWK